ncbi:hypothetical protein BpHYR1_044388 [Brachionus plicatilis]|uniref:Uncharacterized protein n=1 Tax=Brachionus plicatilis TaxID=10195 RepID=A0A3M7SW93_BRAPC|nr:hypothetical protein BpHYR1_044388 [Brachionus plicatilis]
MTCLVLKPKLVKNPKIKVKTIFFVGVKVKFGLYFWKISHIQVNSGNDKILEKDVNQSFETWTLSLFINLKIEKNK